MIATVLGAQVVIVDDAAARAAAEIAAHLAAAVAARGRGALAVSGGSTGPALLAALAAADLRWAAIGIWQVDERVAPDGDPARNAAQLDGIPGEHHLMPVTSGDLPGPRPRMPRRCRTASTSSTSAWGPTATPRRGRPATRSSTPRGRSTSAGAYQDHVRMTLTPSVVNAPWPGSCSSLAQTRPRRSPVGCGPRPRAADRPGRARRHGHRARPGGRRRPHRVGGTSVKLDVGCSMSVRRAAGRRRPC